MSDLPELLAWLRSLCASYEPEFVAVYRRHGDHPWPLHATDPDDLEKQLAAGGHFLPLPQESAALANTIEVSIADYLVRRASEHGDVEISRGTERGYPDLEISGEAFRNNFYAVDIKVARRKVNDSGKVNRRKTQSRITLYTGNTYFKYPQLQWPGMFRPFQDYAAHLDVIAIYTLEKERTSRIKDLELIVQETWRIASRQRSSTTREYLGAVDDIDRLRDGRGEFATADEFYKFWRDYPFKIGPSIAKQLERLLKEKYGSS